MQLKSTKVYPASKRALEDFKKQLGLKSEAEVIRHLIDHYRGSVKVHEIYRVRLTELLDHLKMDSAADVIGYLAEHYIDRWGSITMNQDQKYRETVEDNKRQGVIE